MSRVRAKPTIVASMYGKAVANVESQFTVSHVTASGTNRMARLSPMRALVLRIRPFYHPPRSALPERPARGYQTGLLPRLVDLVVHRQELARLQLNR